jgi:predicted  nucleic acid-binding Zn-ribbon protein
METQIFPTDAQQLKSYWNRPGGKFGTLAGLGILAAIGYYVLPILTSIVWNTLNFGIALACLGIFLYCVTHRKFRLSLFYLYEILMKKLVGVVIELDPFIIAEDYINDMQEEREKLYKQATDVDAQKEKLHAKIKEKESEISKLMSKAQVAKEKNMMPELGNATRQIGRLNEYIKQLSPIHDNLYRIGDYLTKIHKNSAYLIEDAKNELELKKDLYKSVTSGNKALTSALKIFKGDPEKKLMVEQSMEFLKEDIASKLANMKKAISYSSDFMKSIDLDNATYEKEGLKMLDTFNPDNEFKLASSHHNRVATASTVSGDYGDLLK